MIGVAGPNTSRLNGSFMSAWLAFSSVWIGVASLAMAIGMLMHRPLMSDNAIVAVLYFGAPAALCCAGLVLWDFRKEMGDDPAVYSQRLQAKVGIGFAMAAAAIIYALIILSEKLEPV